MERVGIEGIVLNLLDNSPVLILKSKKGKVLPIAIGIFEAQSILIALEKASFARPLTHDLIKNIINSFSAGFIRTEIHSIKGGVYYANLVVRKNGKIEKIDCRPSDAIAVALRFNGEIFVEENLMEEAEIVKNGKDIKFFKTGGIDRPIDTKEAEEFRKEIENMNPGDFWKEIKGK